MYNETSAVEEREDTKAEMVIESIQNQLTTLERKINIILTPETPVAGNLKAGEATRLQERLRSVEDRIAYLISRINL